MKKIFSTIPMFLLLGVASFAQVINCATNYSFTSSPPLSTQGTFVSGTTVTFCYTVTDYNQNQADWLCGIEPVFGPGWDLSTIIPLSVPVPCSGDPLGFWHWYLADTTVHNGGVLPNFIHGPGFYYIGNQGLSLPYDSVPGHSFGDNCATTGYVRTFCFSIKAKSCGAAPDGTDLSVVVHIYGDYEAGSWGSDGCRDSIIFPATINSPNPVTIDTLATTNITSCYGDSSGTASVTASNGFTPYQYLWSNGLTTQTITGLTGGTYSVLVTDSTGCQKIVYFLIQQPPQIVFNPTVIGIGCSASSTGSISANVSGGIAPYNYLWSNGATTDSITGLTGGTYTLTVTDASGCVNTGSWTINTVPPLIVSYTSTDAICGNSNGTATITATGTPPYIYTWTPPVSTTANATGLSAGLYIVQVTDSNGCSVTDSITVNSIATFTVNTSADTANCAGTGGSGTVSVIGSSGPYTYQWSPSGGTDSTAVNLNSGTYTVVITDANNCSQTVTVVVAQMTSSVTATTVVTQSPCDTTTLATIGTNPGNGTSPYTYIWTTGATTSTVTGLGAGTYTVIVTDANQCTAVASASIAPFNPVSFTTTSSPSCTSNPTGSASVATTTGGSSPYTYQWSNGSSSASIAGVATGNYAVTVTDANSCSVSANVNVSSLPAINVSVLPPDTTGPPPLNITFTNNSTGGISYFWNFGDGSTTPGHDASHVYSSDGTYNGYLVVTNSDGCTDTGKFTITVKSSSSLTIYNVFTPNSDPHNESWSIMAQGILSLSTEVYNRWGEKIFERDYLNNVVDGVNDIWNGTTKNGEKAPSGTYFYIVKAHANDKDYDQSGTITLIRDVKK